MNRTSNIVEKKLALGLLPFWSPLIPPQGITTLKSYLKENNYDIVTFDGNIEPQFKRIYNSYFGLLRKFIPEQNHGNFYNIGHDVMRNHIMAFFRKKEEKDYQELVKSLVHNTYFIELSEEQIYALEELLIKYSADLKEYLISFIEQEKPTIIGFTAHIGTLGSTLYAFKVIKEYYPEITTILGGTIFCGELVVESPNFDFFINECSNDIDKIFIGRSENLLLDYLEGKLESDKKIYYLDDYKERTLDFLRIPLPDLSDLDHKQYPYMVASGSISCPHRCKFCNVESFFGAYKEKNLDQVVDDIQIIYEKHKNQLFFMNDSLLNSIIGGLSTRLIEKELSVYMDGYFRVCEEASNLENTLLWRKGGLYRTRIGVESGSQRILDLMEKGINISQIKDTVTSLSHAGIKTTLYFVIGYPGETEDDFQQTLNLLEDLKEEIWQAECNPFYYYYTGQNNSDKWADKRKLLYAEKFNETLLTPTWVLNIEPSREERFDRLFRFTNHCKKLGIPNPYTTKEIHEADKRWKLLHDNAVPSLIEFESTNYIDDKDKIKDFVFAQTNDLDCDFNF